MPETKEIQREYSKETLELASHMQKNSILSPSRKKKLPSVSGEIHVRHKWELSSA